MGATEVFGRIVTAADIDAAVLDTLAVWLTAYVDEVSGQGDVDVPHPVGVVVRQEAELWDYDRLPLVIVSTGEAEFTGRAGSIEGRWDVRVSVLVNGKGSGEARGLVMRLAAAVRACLAQKHPGVTVTGEAYASVDMEDSDTVGGAEVTLVVLVPAVTSLGEGPLGPAPHAPIPRVESTHVETTIRETT